MNDDTFSVFFWTKRNSWRTSPKRHVNITFQDLWPLLLLCCSTILSKEILHHIASWQQWQLLELGQVGGHVVSCGVQPIAPQVCPDQFGESHQGILRMGFHSVLVKSGASWQACWYIFWHVSYVSHFNSRCVKDRVIYIPIPLQMFG